MLVPAAGQLLSVWLARQLLQNPPRFARRKLFQRENA